MIEEIKLPEISENVDSGVVIGVLVKIGDIVKAEQPVLELETEKATFEVPCPVGGRIVEIHVSENDEVRVGQAILKVDTEAAAGQGQAMPQPQPAPQEARRTGGGPAGRTSAEPPTSPRTPTETETPEPGRAEPAESSSGVSASPAARRLAREMGIDINKVIPGSAGRVSIADVKGYTGSVAGERRPSADERTARTLPDFSGWGLVQRAAMSVTRRKIADILSYAGSHVPHVTQYDQADITGLEQFRAECAEEIRKVGGKLTITSILLKVVASALQAFPKFNASVDAEAYEIVFKRYYHIGVAVDTDRGLLVPVVRDVDKKSIRLLSIELNELAQKTRDSKLTPEDMLGGNFTISNLGGLGGGAFAPIIYWPQVAILGVARACDQPRYIGGECPQRRLILPLSLSYDHRIIDGGEGVRFLRFIVDKLEKPFLLAGGQ